MQYSRDTYNNMVNMRTHCIRVRRNIGIKCHASYVNYYCYDRRPYDVKAINYNNRRVYGIVVAMLIVYFMLFN